VTQLIAIPLIIALSFLLALYLGGQEERPSQIEWKLSETTTAACERNNREQGALSSPAVVSESLYDWNKEAVFILPPTGPDLLVLDLQERTRDTA
jgi:hypothetical protein